MIQVYSAPYQPVEGDVAQVAVDSFGQFRPEVVREALRAFLAVRGTVTAGDIHPLTDRRNDV